MLEGARSIGIHTFEAQNGSMMRVTAAARFTTCRFPDGKRQSIFRSYVFPYMNQANITELTHALVSRVIFEGKRATGVEIIHNGKPEYLGVPATRCSA